jgi:ribosome-binding factor A
VIPPDCNRTETATALERASGHLRREVASAISRRYTPELTFEVLNG